MTAANRYACAYIYVCANIYVCEYLLYTHVHKISTFLYMCIGTQLRARSHECRGAHVYVSTYMHACMHACIHTQIHRLIYTYTNCNTKQFFVMFTTENPRGWVSRMLGSIVLQSVVSCCSVAMCCSVHNNGL